jgi:pimeloyl-ACP methyl ester carboxylesterase
MMCDSMSFETDLSDDEAGYAIEPRAGAPMLIAFGGMRGSVLMPPFEFFKVTEGLDVTRVFVRDHQQLWYQRGVRGLGDSANEVADSIAALRDTHSSPRVVTCGVSMGGFAALLFGSLLGCEGVRAFGPQTVLSAQGRAKIGETRWKDKLARVLAIDDVPTTLDLATVRASADTEIHFALRHKLDRRHATHLAFHGVKLRPHFEKSHAKFVRDLRDRGVLRRCLETALDPS